MAYSDEYSYFTHTGPGVDREFPASQLQYRGQPVWRADNNPRQPMKTSPMFLNGNAKTIPDTGGSGTSGYSRVRYRGTDVLHKGYVRNGTAEYDKYTMDHYGYGLVISSCESISTYEILGHNSSARVDRLLLQNEISLGAKDPLERDGYKAIYANPDNYGSIDRYGVRVVVTAPSFTKFAKEQCWYEKDPNGYGGSSCFYLVTTNYDLNIIGASTAMTWWFHNRTDCMNFYNDWKEFMQYDNGTSWFWRWTNWAVFGEEPLPMDREGNDCWVRHINDNWWVYVGGRRGYGGPTEMLAIYIYSAVLDSMGPGAMFRRSSPGISLNGDWVRMTPRGWNGQDGSPTHFHLEYFNSSCFEVNLGDTNSFKPAENLGWFRTIDDTYSNRGVPYEKAIGNLTQDNWHMYYPQGWLTYSACYSGGHCASGSSMMRYWWDGNGGLHSSCSTPWFDGDDKVYSSEMGIYSDVDTHDFMNWNDKGDAMFVDGNNSVFNNPTDISQTVGIILGSACAPSTWNFLVKANFEQWRNARYHNYVRREY